VFGIAKRRAFTRFARFVKDPDVSSSDGAFVPGAVNRQALV
jgi:hypothetical protein